MLRNYFKTLWRNNLKNLSTTIINVFGLSVGMTLGLFTLAAFTAEQKSKEIGIRKVLGASVSGITQLLTMSFLKLDLIAFVIASLIALMVMNTWLQDFAYWVNINVWMFIISGLIAMTIAVSTISVQAVKAAVANSVKSLRTE